MIKSLLGESRRHLRHKKNFTPVYGAMLLLSLHWAVVLYVHSTYLGTLMSVKTVAALFILGSVLSTIALFYTAQALSRFGNYLVTIGLALIETLALLAIGFTHHPIPVAIFFVVHQAVVPLLLFNLDIFVESKIGKDEQETGRTRGILLVLMNLAAALAPLAAGFMIGGSDAPRFSLVYIAGAAIMVPFLLLIHRYFSNFKDPHYADMHLKFILRTAWRNTDLRYVLIAHLLLQLFFSWMVIYVPLYLATVVGFSWDTLGVILSMGIFAYVLFEYPVGRIADLYTGEKEMMAFGFLILGMTTVWLSFITSPIVLPWVVAMFMTRIGAAMVEATTEAYFFKHATGENAGVIGLFRITRPASMVLGTLLGYLVLLIVPFQYIFVPLGLLMLLGISASFFLHDTK